MSNNRLDSISRPSGNVPGGGPSKQSLKFKPKVVARRTKEERDSNVPVATPGVSKKPGSLAKNLQRNSRTPGTRHLQNTKVVMAGPLAMGTVSLANSGQSKGTKMVKKSADTYDLAQSLKAQTTKKAKENTESDYEGEDDTTARIDLGQAYDWKDVDTQYFPVRAERQQHYEYGEEPLPDSSIKTEIHREVSVPVDSEPTSREQSVEIKQEEDATLKFIPNEQANADASITDYQGKQEAVRLADDYRAIISKLEDIQLEENAEEMLFLQLPKQLNVESASHEVKMEVDDELSQNEGTASDVIGTLRVHESGKVTMKMGDTVLDVTRGAATHLVQSIVQLDEGTKECLELGTVNEKIIASLSLSDEI
ncbi:hypothetical protein KL914_003968 [Ogataea haglerorum]|nr:hypothetical protein KL914_003968 [Ogataea haglerorum]